MSYNLYTYPKNEQQGEKRKVTKEKKETKKRK
jgi:hypothetical protein